MIQFFEIDPINFVEIAKTFDKDDFRIFPLSRRPKYFLTIKNLYEIKNNQQVVGYIFILKNKIYIDNDAVHDVCIYLWKDYRSVGIGKLSLSQFMKEHSPLFFVFSLKNMPMVKIASDTSKFSQFEYKDKNICMLAKF